MGCVSTNYVFMTVNEWLLLLIPDRDSHHPLRIFRVLFSLVSFILSHAKDLEENIISIFFSLHGVILFNQSRQQTPHALEEAR